jgi:undecaprenyl-diphosphatase
MTPAVRFGARAVLGVAAVVAAVGLAAAAMEMLMLRGLPVLAELDRDTAAVLDRVLENRPVAVTVFSVLTALGGNVVMWWLATVTAAGMVLRRQPRLAAFLAVTGVGALVIGVLVRLVVRWLPPDRPDAETTARSAFPSGHAINAVVFYGALLLVFLPVIPRRMRGLSIAGVSVLVAAIGFARAAVGVQYFSDILGGWIVGLAWLAVMTYAFRRWRDETGRERRPLLDGLEPEAAAVLAPQRTVHMAHPGRAAAVMLGSAVVVGGVVLGFGLLLAWMAPPFDDAVPRWFAAHHSGTMDGVTAVLAWAGNTKAIVSIGLVIAPLAIGCVHRWRPAVYMAALIAGEFALVLTIATLVARPVPTGARPVASLPVATFPAGPTAATVCLFGALAVILIPRTRPRGPLRRATQVVVVAVPVGVAAAGLYRGVYRPLDIAGAVLLGLLWLAAATLALNPNVDLHEPPPAEPALGAGEVLVDELNGDGAGAHGGRDALDRPVAHVADREDTGNAGLHR